MEFLTRLSWVDLVLIGVLAGGVFAGFTQGMMRYLLNAVAVLVAFVVASQLKDPIHDLLGFWDMFNPAGENLLIFIILFVGLVVAAFIVIRQVYHRTSLPLIRQLDEIGGAIFGLLFVALAISFTLVVYDSYFIPGGITGGWVKDFYDAMNGSLIVSFFRETLIPGAGYVVRPFVPAEVADLLLP